MINTILQSGLEVSLTTSEAILFSAVISIILFGAIKFRSMITIITFFFTMMAFIGYLQFEMNIIYFWVAVMFSFISLSLSSIIYTYGGKSI